MNKMNKFNQAYLNLIKQDIVSQGLGKFLGSKVSKLANKVSKGLIGSSQGKIIHEALTRALKDYGFEIGAQGEDGQNFNQAEKLIQRNVKDKQNPENIISKFYKIIIKNDFDENSQSADYSIKCINALTGKKIKIKSNNFILKDSQTPDEIIEKVINPCIAPLSIKKGNDDEARAALAKKKQEIQSKKDADDADKKAKETQEAEAKAKTQKQNSNVKQLLTKYSNRANTALDELKTKLTSVSDKMKSLPEYAEAKNMLSKYDEIDDNKDLSDKQKLEKFKEFAAEVNEKIEKLDAKTSTSNQSGSTSKERPKCPKCHRFARKDDNFCQNCGTKIK